MKNLKKIFPLLAIAGTFTLGGCIEETMPEGYINSTHSSAATLDQINESSAALEASLAGIPSLMTQGYYLYGRQEYEYDMAYPGYMIAFTEMLGDLYPCAEPGYDHYQTYNNGAVSGGFGPRNAIPYLAWFTFYKYIKVCNDVISMVDIETEDNPNNLAVAGSAYACRAFQYFMLTTMFEPVPSIYVDNSKVLGSNAPHTALTVCKVTEKTTAEEAKSNPRMTHDEVVALMLSDLDIAENCFAAMNPTSRNMPNLASTYGLKAKVYLWDEDFANAAKYARMAIDAFDGAPMNQNEWLDVTSAFSVAVPSWMWYVSYAPESMQNLANYIGWISGEADWSYSSLTGPAIDKSLYDKIGDTDFRKATFLDPDRSKTLAWYGGKYEKMTVHKTSDDPTGQGFIDNAVDYLSLKFRCKNGDWQSYSVGGASDVPVMRVEEMYLIEAFAQGKQNVGKGVALLNSFIQQYRDPSYNCTASSERDFELEALTQMRIEFWGEGNAFPVAKRVAPDVIQNYDGTNAPSNTFKFNCRGGKPTWTMCIPNSEVQSNQVLEDQQNADPSQTVKYTEIGEFAPANF